MLPSVIKIVDDENIWKGSITMKVVSKKTTYPIRNGIANTIKQLKAKGLIA